MPGFALSTGVAKMSGHCLGLRVSMVLTIAKRFIHYHIPEKASCYLRRYKKEKSGKDEPWILCPIKVYLKCHGYRKTILTYKNVGNFSPLAFLEGSNKGNDIFIQSWLQKQQKFFW